MLQFKCNLLRLVLEIFTVTDFVNLFLNSECLSSQKKNYNFLTKLLNNRQKQVLVDSRN